MMNRTAWLCALAISLAAILGSMVSSGKDSRAGAPVMTSQFTPIHSLTTVSFHSVSEF